MVTCYRRIEARFASWFTVEPYVPQRYRSGERVAQDAAAVVGAGVVADEEQPVEAAVHASTHATDAVLVPADQLDAGVEHFPDEVEHAVVGVGDDHLSRPAVECPTNRGIGVLGHPLACPLVIVALGRTVRPPRGRLPP